MTGLYQGMLSALPAFFESLLSWQMLIGLLIGIFGGLIIGALPGLGPTTAIPLLLPLTYVMEPIPAMVMLCAIYTCGLTGGSYSSILINTPGTGGNVPTTFDGYPMAANGGALKACEISTWSSSFGGLISAVMLLFLAPALATVSLLFDSAEYFLLGVFGVSLIASLASDDLLKGVISGCFGLCLSCIGQFPLGEQYRFTYGTQMLKTGVPTTLVLLGLFAVARVLGLTIKTFSSQHAGPLKKIKLEFKDVPRYTWKERIKMMPLTISSSIQGLLIGILPGAGGNIASFVAYDSAKKSSKHPEKFGTGCVEGIVAPESANNAVTGGAMIPMMTLGIPGSPAAALLMSALVIQGFAPGFSLFTEKADTTYPIIFGFILVNILMYFAGMIFVRGVSKIVEIPDAVLNTVVIVLVCLGVYSIASPRFGTEFVILCFAFGFIGYFFNLSKYSNAGVTLGIVLGTMTEKGLRRSIVMARGNLLSYYLNRPVCVILALLIVFTLLWPEISKLIKKHGKKKGQKA